MPDTSIATRECVVYWLYDEKCVCLWKHGYIGVSQNWPGRLKNHRKKFPAFRALVLFVGTKAACRKLEFKLRPDFFIGWNYLPGGGRSPRAGVIVPEHVRQKMSEAGKRRAPMSAKTREKLRINKLGTTNKGRIGQKKSDAERAKIAASNTGKVRLNPAVNARYGNTSHLGYTHTEQTKELIRKKKIGVPIHSDEEKEKRRQRMKGNAFTKDKPWSTARRLAWLNRQPKSTP
jgi:hypothetical protein